MRGHLVRAGVVVAVLLSLTGCLGVAGDTSQIALVSSTTASGWRFDFYRNSAYPCSISGDQTFTIATRIGSSASAPAPLWTFMHGGGVGVFDATGTPQPDATQMTEEAPGAQRSNLLNPALMARVRGDSAGYRLLAVSYCNRDGYSGTGQTDPNNPNLLPDGSARTTNGMLATKAAIQFTESAFPTHGLILHGASAGSEGAFNVGYGLQVQGVAPSGVIADASVLNIEAQAAAYDQGACRKASYTPAGQQAISGRVDPVFIDPGNEIDRLVSTGRYTVPLLHIWNHGDVNSCGQTTMTCPLRDGTTAVMSVTDCQHAALAAAITALGPTATSENLPVCVSTEGHTGQCDRHQVTLVDLTNTDPATPADYLTAIMTWADARIGP